ncbi:PREDICTED: ankyrin-3 [Camelina sativa]|uniref:Ankyrin-3 n=1 Tax=Camelina sativa TaxID=90675 RepID=A0ABM0SV96_CAMSA|nr:PREDICTED: ankyrin-3 [Camelina sativa]
MGLISSLGDEIPVEWTFPSTAGDLEARLIRQLEANPSILEKLDKNNYEETILHKAVTDGYEGYAKKIIDFCPSVVSFTNIDGNTPLHLAAQTGNKYILLKMLQSREAKCKEINKQGQTAFILACFNNHVDAARILIEGASSMTMVELAAAFSRQQPAIISSILEKFPNLVLNADEEQTMLSTLLHNAITQGYEEFATKIINIYPSVVSFINDDGNTPLHLAAEIGNKSIISKMLKSEAACMKIINRQGHTAFTLACLNNHVDAARILMKGTSSMTMVELNAAFSVQQPGIIENILERFPSIVLETDEEQSTLLHKACKSGNLEMAKTLLDVDQEIAEKVNKDGLTPLHYAAINGSVEILKEFLDKTPSSFHSTTQGTSETVFHLAARHQNTKAFIFMAKSANLGQLLYNMDAEYNSVLHVAASVDSTSALVRYILTETTIDATLKNKRGIAAVDLFNKDGVDKNNYEDTILHNAVTDGYKGYAQKIIDICPSLISFTNVDGNTPLHLAAQIGNKSIILKMLESGEATCIEMINKQGHTAFILACLNNHVDVAKILVAGASSMKMVELDAAFSRQQSGIIDIILEWFPKLVLETDEEQSTLLHKACKSGNLEMAKTLLDVDQEIAEKVNKDGLTPLHYAAISGSVEILKEFLNKAPSSFNSTTQGTTETVFHLAVKHQNTKAFIFMAQSANLGQLLYNMDAEDNTVLHVAASVDATALVRYILIETTIDVTLKNKNGFAAVDLLNKDGVDFPLLSLWFRQGAEKIKRPSKYVKFAHETGEPIRNTNNLESLIFESREVEWRRDPRNKEREMHSESLQNARNTITIVAVLIASVAFTSGINPPGGVHQDGLLIGKATAGSTTAFKIFSVTNNIALFTSLSIVTLLVSIISYRTKSLKMFVFIAHKMMWLAVASMATAYAAAAWITVPHHEGSKWLVYTTSAIASFALGSMFVYVSYMMAKHILKKGKLKRNLSHRKAASATLDMEAGGDAGCYAY